MVFRPATLTAEVLDSDMQALQTRLQSLNGVLCVQRDGLLLGVLTESEHVLLQIARQIEEGAAQGQFWRCHVEAPNPANLPGWLKAQALDTTVVVDTAPPNATPPVQSFRAQYQRPYLQHASIGLCCALAKWQEDAQQLEVWSHSQGIYNLRRDLALAFQLPPAQVQVSHAEGAGCYGHNGADDVAFDAAWLARWVPGRPVRVQWTRQAELGHAPLAPAMAVEIEAGLNSDGQLIEWTQTVWSQGHGTRPGRGTTPALLGAWQTAQPHPVTMAVNAAMAVGGGSERNAQPPYDITSVKVLNHRVLNMPQRVSAMRALGAPVNVFAAESFMDEMAQQQSQEPLAFRLAHLREAHNTRAVAVLNLLADMADWHAPRPEKAEGSGRGLAYARYKNTGALCAVAVEIVVEDKVKLHKIWIAQLSAQGIASKDWDHYPILKFSDMPQVQVQLMHRPDQASLGAGECSSGPTCAAIGNAIFDAIGVRMRTMPFTPDNLLQAIHADGLPVPTSNP